LVQISQYLCKQHPFTFYQHPLKKKKKKAVNSDLFGSMSI